MPYIFSTCIQLHTWTVQCIMLKVERDSYGQIHSDGKVSSNTCYLAWRSWSLSLCILPSQCCNYSPAGHHSFFFVILLPQQEAHNLANAGVVSCVYCMLIRYLWLLHTTCPFMNVGGILEYVNDMHIKCQMYSTKYGTYSMYKYSNTLQTWNSNGIGVVQTWNGNLLWHLLYTLFIIARNSDQVLCLDSLTEQLNFCLDKFNKCSENVQCLAIISGSVHMQQTQYPIVFLCIFHYCLAPIPFIGSSRYYTILRETFYPFYILNVCKCVSITKTSICYKNKK